MLTKRLVAGMLAFLAVSSGAAVAQETKPHPRKPEAAVKSQAPERNPCAAYGAGFARIEGTSTCVKVGGHITVDVGSRSPR
jgi:hypothetical protein